MFRTRRFVCTNRGGDHVVTANLNPDVKNSYLIVIEELASIMEDKLDKFLAAPPGLCLLHTTALILALRRGPDASHVPSYSVFWQWRWMRAWFKKTYDYELKWWRPRYLLSTRWFGYREGYGLWVWLSRHHTNWTRSVYPWWTRNYIWRRSWGGSQTYSRSERGKNKGLARERGW